MPLTEDTRLKAREIIARYPRPRSALLPILHLIQAEEGYVTPGGIDLAAEELGITRAEVGAVATFYTMYKRKPPGTYHVGVCTNTLCAVMGGDAIYQTLKEQLGVTGQDETTADGKISLEHIECNAACDYAPVVMVNWEFFDYMTPGSARKLVEDLQAGRPVKPTRGPDQVPTFKEVEHVLAGFPDGRAGQGVSAGPASLLGLEIAHARNEKAPSTDSAQPSGPAQGGTA
jgi:NADH-quinone oxidoreductase subunit E